MAWNHTAEPIVIEKVKTKEELLKVETNWTSSYNEPERWIKDLKESHYNLIGEYEVDKTHKLYRFEIDEKEPKDATPRFQNVLIDASLPQIKLGSTFTAEAAPVKEKPRVTVCETCKRPLEDKK
jgi:hypothetical protein